MSWMPPSSKIWGLKLWVYLHVVVYYVVGNFKRANVDDIHVWVFCEKYSRDLYILSLEKFLHCEALHFLIF